MLPPRTFQNPVYARDCADPFVLKHCGMYWAYHTGFWPDGRCFGILRSKDLLHWEAVGAAMDPLPGGATCYWAPEVTYHNGQFLMYYSVGDEVSMVVRVAVAQHPQGPFVDSGHTLTTEQFAIDAHVFVDDNGQRYLFYATDFLEHSHIGTGTVCARLADPWTLAEAPRAVTRARYDWQVYDPARIEKGGVRWHTVEGPFVLKRKGRYYQMFSGGNWQNVSYGVSYALSNDLTDPAEWTQVADGAEVLPILRTIPPTVIGPGHNSVVRGPDNLQTFCVYHRWNDARTARMLALDVMDWAGERMFVLGPSTTPQPSPTQPTTLDLFDIAYPSGLGPTWACTGGDWSIHKGTAIQSDPATTATATCRTSVAAFVCEVSLRALNGPTGRYGLALYSGNNGLGLHTNTTLVLRCLLTPSALLTEVADGDQMRRTEVALPADFNHEAFHLLRVEVNGGLVTITVDDQMTCWQGELAPSFKQVALLTEGCAAAFAGFALTAGWQDLFSADLPLATLGWHSLGSTEPWAINDQQLWHTAGPQAGLLIKGPLLASYTLEVNARLVETSGLLGGYGIYPALRPNAPGPLFRLQAEKDQWVLACSGPGGAHRFPLPGFDPNVYQQFRFRKQQTQLAVFWEDRLLGEITSLPVATQIGLMAQQATACFDMVRVTALR